MQKSRGRPKADELYLADQRTRVYVALETLLAETHSTQITVEQVLIAANISRPTFYRWFPDGLTTAIEHVIAQANLKLLQEVMDAIATVSDAEARIQAGISAYFAWGTRTGPIIKCIYREIFQPDTAAYRHRTHSVQQLARLLSDQSTFFGLTGLDATTFETLISCIEQAGHVAFREREPSPALIAQQCQLAITIVISTLRTYRVHAQV